jgi:hypothetical protein
VKAVCLEGGVRWISRGFHRTDVGTSGGLVMLELEGIENPPTRPAQAWRQVMMERIEDDPGRGLDSPLSEATV